MPTNQSTQRRYRAETSFSGLGPGQLGSLVVKEPALVHGFILSLNGLAVADIETIKVIYNEATAFEAPGSYFKARNIYLRNNDPDTSHKLFIDFQDIKMQGLGIDFGPSVNMGVADPQTGALVNTIDIQVKLSDSAPVGGSVTAISIVGPQTPIIEERGGPGVVRRILQHTENNIVVGSNDFRRIIEGGERRQKAQVSRIWFNLAPDQVERFEVRDGSAVEMEVDAAAMIAEQASFGRTPVTTHFVIDPMLIYGGGAFNAELFGDFFVRAYLKDGASPLPANVTITTEFLGLVI